MSMLGNVENDDVFVTNNHFDHRKRKSVVGFQVDISFLSCFQFKKEFKIKITDRKRLDFWLRA